MLINTDKTFAELRADGENFRAAMLDIQRYSTDKQEALGSISRMRFLAAVPADPNLNEQRPTHDPNSLEINVRAECTRADIPAFQPGQRRFPPTNAGEHTGCQHFVAVF